MGQFMRTGPISGAELARLSTAPRADLSAPTAAYYDGANLKPTSEFSRSRDAVLRHQQDLWSHSLRWAAVTDAELASAGLPL